MSNAVRTTRSTIETKRWIVLSVGIAIAGVALAAAAVFIYLRQEADRRCTRWRADFAIASANMDKALQLNDRAMVKALGDEFGSLLDSQPEGCDTPPRRL